MGPRIFLGVAGGVFAGVVGGIFVGVEGGVLAETRRGVREGLLSTGLKKAWKVGKLMRRFKDDKLILLENTEGLFKGSESGSSKKPSESHLVLEREQRICANKT